MLVLKVRPIDANALQKAVTDLKPNLHDQWETVDVWNIIEQMPSLTVYNLRLKGRWSGMTTSCGEKAICSACGFGMFVNEPGNGLLNIEDLHFCPNCGAKME